MVYVKSKLTVFFDDPYWVGVYERETNSEVEVAKIVFGAEPKDYEIYQYFLQNWSKLKFSPPVEADNTTEKKLNPKRVQRQINRLLLQQGIGTKAQQALKLQQEERKIERIQTSKTNKETTEQRKYDLRHMKKKEKHKGR